MKPLFNTLILNHGLGTLFSSMVNVDLAKVQPETFTSLSFKSQFRLGCFVGFLGKAHLLASLRFFSEKSEVWEPAWFGLSQTYGQLV